MWTSKNRARYDRSKLRYPSDLTDDEWGLVEPLIPPGKRGGGKRTVIMREVVNGLMYVLSTGCQWRAIPKDLPPKSSYKFMAAGKTRMKTAQEFIDALSEMNVFIPAEEIRDDICQEIDKLDPAFSQKIRECIEAQ